LPNSLLFIALAFAVGFGAIGSFIASKKGHTERFGFMIGFLFGLFGVIGLLLMSDKSKNDRSRDQSE
jgi:vacuolar-type H+-ATPase subunit I/STV1|tara:strand:+ start:11228 stop:11428 length:201 start_codon:yes stop_codon:yes gene_type:complete